MRSLTKRYIISSLDGLDLSAPIRYERYYINDGLRIQSKNGAYQKETLDADNNITVQTTISADEFQTLKSSAQNEIIRNSYLYLKDRRVSIKEYLGAYAGLIRVEVSFKTAEEEQAYQKEEWMGPDITASPLAFDKYLSKLSPEDFQTELSKYFWQTQNISCTIVLCK